MSQEETQEELFNRLLDDLEKSPAEIPSSFFTAIKEPLTDLHQEALNFHCKVRDIIKVMKSGIFLNGGLKGRPLPGKNSYEVYFFEDLAYVIVMATYYITGDIPSGKLLKDLEVSFHDPKLFDEAIELIKRLEYQVKIFKSKRHLNKLNQIRIDLKTIKLDIIDRHIVFPAILTNRPDNIDDLILLIRSHLPIDTPILVISNAISTLFKRFNKHVESDAIRQRITRGIPA